MNIFVIGSMLIGLSAVVDTISLVDRKVTVTFHNYLKSWNEAQEVCSTLGGILFIEDSAEKAAVFANFRSYWVSEYPLSDWVWIGLHSLNMGGSYTWVYGKPTCQEIDSSVHSHWDSGQTLTSATKRCAFSSYLFSNVWFVTRCQWSIYKFVCERQENESCSFSETTGTPKPSLSDRYQTLSSGTSDFSSCRDACLTAVYSDLNCWVATYEPGICVLYFMTDPFLFSDNANIDTSSHQLFLKDCYTREADTTDDTTITTNVNADPILGCSGIATTSSAPASSTSDSTTTTITVSSAPGVSNSLTTVSTTTVTTSSSAPGVSYSPTAVSTSTVTTSSSAPGVSNSPTAVSTTTVTTSSSTPGVSNSPTAGPVSSILATGSSTESASSAVPTLQTSKCPCVCSNLVGLYRNFSVNPEFANLTSVEILEKIVEELRVNKSSLSSTIRSKTSAEDNRPTSVSVGIVSIAFMVTAFGLLLAGDGIKLASYMAYKLTSSAS